MGAYITIPLSVRLAATPIFYVPRVFGLRPLDGMYRGKKFAAFLNASLPPAEREMANFKIPFGAVVLNIVDGQVQTLRKGDFAQAIEASSAVPMLRKPVRINGQLFIDGGVCANVPVTQAREMGADIVIAVDVDERFNPMALDKLTDTGTVMHRVLTLNLAKADEAELHAADIVIHPNVDGIGLIDSREQDMRAAICAGEDAARNALPGIKARLGAVGITLRRPGGPSPTRVAGPNQTEY
jgi:NTE family protein